MMLLSKMMFKTTINWLILSYLACRVCFLESVLGDHERGCLPPMLLFVLPRYADFVASQATVSISDRLYRGNKFKYRHISFRGTAVRLGATLWQREIV